MIGLTLVAVGTSIPDIMASIIAARKGEMAIAVGNLAWSDIAAEPWIVADYGMVCLTSILFIGLFIAYMTVRIGSL